MIVVDPGHLDPHEQGPFHILFPRLSPTMDRQVAAALRARVFGLRREIRSGQILERGVAVHPEPLHHLEEHPAEMSPAPWRGELLARSVQCPLSNIPHRPDDLVICRRLQVPLGPPEPTRQAEDDGDDQQHRE